MRGAHAQECRDEAWRIILRRYKYDRDHGLLDGQQEPEDDAPDADEKPEPDDD